MVSVWCRGMRNSHWHLYGHERCVSWGGKGKRPPVSICTLSPILPGRVPASDADAGW